jgi:uncharacterized protein
MIDLSDLRVVDNHVHPWRASTQFLTLDQLAGAVAFSDEVSVSVRQPFLPAEELQHDLRLFRRTTLGVHYFLSQLGRFLGLDTDVGDDWEGIASARNAAAGADYRAWTQRLFADARIETLLVDEGGAVPRITLAELGAIVPARLHRVARSDNFIRDLLPEQAPWATFLSRYDQALDEAVVDGAFAFKSVIAYRTGLDVKPVSEDVARQNYEATLLQPESEQKGFRDFLLCRTLDVARERGLWIHMHAAVGDPDIVYDRANPAQLYPLLHSERFRSNKVVLVHSGWPWSGEAAAMVAILPNVYLDMSEGALFGMPNVGQRIREVLEVCPYAKVLYGADGSLPETLWIAARRFKSVLGRVLAALVGEGFCSQREAYAAARAILAENAERLYGLPSHPSA